MTRQVICDDCPCLNTDSEYGYNCNLDYDMPIKFEFKIESPVSFHYAHKCPLVKVETEGRVFIPTELPKEFQV